MTKINATILFVFSHDLTQVLLIHKNRPEWQAGKINGLGGKVEPGETAVEGAIREIKEESGLEIDSSEVVLVGSIEFEKWFVYLYATSYKGVVTDAMSITDEKVAWYPINELPLNVIANLRWLIPLSADVLTNQTPPKATITYD